MMVSASCKKFKGEIENYLVKTQNNFDSKIKDVFLSLNVKTWLSRTNIVKQDGYPASHVLLILIMLPFLKVKTVHTFCQKQWHSWSSGKKDTFYRFKQNARYRWRSFMYKINIEIFKQLELKEISQEETFFVTDDSDMIKTGRKIENISYVYDHNQDKYLLGYCIVALGLLTPKGFLNLDFAYRFGKKRHRKSPEENIGDPRSSSGKRSYEAKHFTKLELALMMLKNAVKCGFTAGYALFDRWYACPSFIKEIRSINSNIHVICRLKNNTVRYGYNGRQYSLSQLYQKVKNKMKKDKTTGLLLCRVKVRLPGFEEDSVIVFAKGYCEPEEDTLNGKKKLKKEKWAAFLSTNPNLHSSSIIKKYTRRWSIEVFFKECKQILDLGKDQSNDFNAQVFSTTASFLRYNILTYLNQTENFSTPGKLFENIADESAVITYAYRLWEFFYGLFQTSFSKIFELFEIEDDFQSYVDAISESLKGFAPFQGCET